MLLVYGSPLSWYNIASILAKLIKQSKYKVFDVNLRPPSKDLIIQLMMQSDFVKFNDDELAEISAFMSSPYHSIEEKYSLRCWKDKYKTHLCNQR
jgi:fructokinase